MTADVRPYATLLKALRERRLTPAEFQAVFVPLFKSDKVWRPDAIYAALNEAFLAAEAYDAQPAQDNNPYAVDEAELYAVAASTEARIADASGTVDRPCP